MSPSIPFDLTYTSPINHGTRMRTSMTEGLWISSVVIGILALSSARSFPPLGSPLTWSPSSGRYPTGIVEGTHMEPTDPDLSPKDAWNPSSLFSQIPSPWLLSLPFGLPPRENRAENFIRFGRSGMSILEKNLNNKKNNFIRLGRENPRQNNFIRLGRGQQDENTPNSVGGVNAWKALLDAGTGSWQSSARGETSNDYGSNP